MLPEAFQVLHRSASIKAASGPAATCRPAQFGSVCEQHTPFWTLESDSTEPDMLLGLSQAHRHIFDPASGTQTTG